MTIKERLIALYNLSQQGIGGERENAEEILQRSLKLHNLSMEDLLNNEDERVLYWYSVKDKSEQQLVKHIIGKILNSNTVSYFLSGKQIGFELTQAELISASMLCDLYLKAFRMEKQKIIKQHKKELEHIIASFVLKHNIFPKKENPESDKASKKKEYDPELIIKQMANMEDVQVYPQLMSKQIEGQ